MISIIKLPQERWPEYKELRLTALKEDPQAYTATLEEVLLYPDDKWQLKLEDPLNSTLFAQDGENLVGMMVANYTNKKKTRHVGEVTSVYIAVEYRGRGIGRNLLDAILQEIHDHGGIEKVTSNVVTEQRATYNLYLNEGFEEVGHLRREVKIGNVFYEKYIMEMYL